VASLATPEALARVRLREGTFGPPLFCIHGFLGGPHGFDGLAEALRHPGEIVGLRLPGHGLEPWGVGLATPEQALAELATLLPTGGAHLLGYSMGGRVALALAALAPERVLSVVAIGAHAGLRDAAEREARARTDRARAAALRADGLEAFVDAWERLPLFASQAALPAETRASLRDERLAHTAPGLARALELLSAGALAPVEDALVANGVPVRLIVGSRDEAYVAHSRRLSRGNPSLDVIVVQGVGHNVLLEAFEDVVAIVDLSVARVEQRAARRTEEGARLPTPGTR
jgi:2-succinyl-6-hydroxy-2,4-cyclohexadiene-1-carboxylate synthase